MSEFPGYNFGDAFGAELQMPTTQENDMWDVEYLDEDLEEMSVNEHFAKTFGNPRHKSRMLLENVKPATKPQFAAKSADDDLPYKSWSKSATTKSSRSRSQTPDLSDVSSVSDEYMSRHWDIAMQDRQVITPIPAEQLRVTKFIRKGCTVTKVRRISKPEPKPKETSTSLAPKLVVKKNIRKSSGQRKKSELVNSSISAKTVAEYEYLRRRQAQAAAATATAASTSSKRVCTDTKTAQLKTAQTKESGTTHASKYVLKPKKIIVESLQPHKSGGVTCYASNLESTADRDLKSRPRKELPTTSTASIASKHMLMARKANMKLATQTKDLLQSSGVEKQRITPAHVAACKKPENKTLLNSEPESMIQHIRDINKYSIIKAIPTNPQKKVYPTAAPGCLEPGEVRSDQQTPRPRKRIRYSDFYAMPPHSKQLSNGPVPFVGAKKLMPTTNAQCKMLTPKPCKNISADEQQLKVTVRSIAHAMMPLMAHGEIKPKPIRSRFTIDANIITPTPMLAKRTTATASATVTATAPTPTRSVQIISSAAANNEQRKALINATTAVNANATTTTTLAANTAPNANVIKSVVRKPYPQIRNIQVLIKTNAKQYQKNLPTLVAAATKPLVGGVGGVVSINPLMKKMPKILTSNANITITKTSTTEMFNSKPRTVATTTTTTATAISASTTSTSVAAACVAHTSTSTTSTAIVASSNANISVAKATISSGPFFNLAALAGINIAKKPFATGQPIIINGLNNAPETTIPKDLTNANATATSNTTKSKDEAQKIQTTRAHTVAPVSVTTTTKATTTTSVAAADAAVGVAANLQHKLEPTIRRKSLHFCKLQDLKSIKLVRSAAGDKTATSAAENVLKFDENVHKSNPHMVLLKKKKTVNSGVATTTTTTTVATVNNVTEQNAVPINNAKADLQQPAAVVPAPTPTPTNGAMKATEKLATTTESNIEIKAEAAPAKPEADDECNETTTTNAATANATAVKEQSMETTTTTTLPIKEETTKEKLTESLPAEGSAAAANEENASSTHSILSSPLSTTTTTGGGVGDINWLQGVSANGGRIIKLRNTLVASVSSRSKKRYISVQMGSNNCCTINEDKDKDKMPTTTKVIPIYHEQPAKPKITTIKKISVGKQQMQILQNLQEKIVVQDSNGRRFVIAPKGTTSVDGRSSLKVLKLLPRNNSGPFVANIPQGLTLPAPPISLKVAKNNIKQTEMNANTETQSNKNVASIIKTLAAIKQENMQKVEQKVKTTKLKTVKKRSRKSGPFGMQSISSSTAAAVKAEPLEEQEETKQNDTKKSSKRAERKHCNCSKSQCLKLYCDCFSNGEFCKNCSCRDCHNTMHYIKYRERAIENVLDRNPNAFKPKITASIKSDVRLHNKGCNCKRSGCLKNYCECYEARIPCTSTCKCYGCRNTEMKMHFPPKADITTSITPRKFEYKACKVPELSVGHCSDVIGSEVVKATLNCLAAKLNDDEVCTKSEAEAEFHLLVEFDRCLDEIFDHIGLRKEDFPNVDCGMDTGNPGRYIKPEIFSSDEEEINNVDVAIFRDETSSFRSKSIKPESFSDPEVSCCSNDEDS